MFRSSSVPRQNRNSYSFLPQLQFLGKKISKRFKETRTICFRTILSGKLAFLVFANTASNFVNEESLRIYTNLNTFLECSRSEHGYWLLTNRERNPTVNARQFPALTTNSAKAIRHYLFGSERSIICIFSLPNRP